MPAATCKAHQRQHQHNKKFYDRYRNEERLLKNMAARLMRHIKRMPWNQQPRDLFAKLPEHIRRGLGGMPVPTTSPVVIRKRGNTTLSQWKNGTHMHGGEVFAC